MSRFSTSDNLGVQNNRRLTRKERLYNNRTSSAGVPVPHPSRSLEAHFQSPSANSRISRNPFELLNSVSGDLPYYGRSGSCAYRVNKHQYSRRRNYKRAALRRRHLDEIDGIQSSCPTSRALVRHASPVLQFGSMRPLSLSQCLTRPPAVQVPHPYPQPESKPETAPTLSVQFDEAFLHASCMQTGTSSGDQQTNISTIFKPYRSTAQSTVSVASVPDPMTAHEACTVFQIPDGPALPTKRNSPKTFAGSRPGLGQKKIDSYFAHTPDLPAPQETIEVQSVNRQQSSRQALPTSRLPDVLYHPHQTSHEAAQVFSTITQPPKAKLFSPITSFNSYQAYDAACPSLTNVVSLPSTHMPTWFGERAQHEITGVHEAPDSVQVCPSSMSQHDSHEWPGFVAARLPTFHPDTPSHGAESAGSADTLKGKSEPLLEPLSPPSPSPMTTPIIQALVEKWRKEKERDERKGFTIDRAKASSALDEFDFNLATFLDPPPVQHCEDKSMVGLCAAMDAMSLEEHCHEPSHVNIKDGCENYGFEYADQKDGWDSHDSCVIGDWDKEVCENLGPNDEWENRSNRWSRTYAFGDWQHKLCKAVDPNDQWDDLGDWTDEDSALPEMRCEDTCDQEWAMPSPGLKSDDSDSDWFSDFELEPRNRRRKLTDSDHDAMDIDFAEALRVPLPSSPSTERLIREDTHAQMRVLSEEVNGFVELPGLEWGSESDEFAVRLDLRNDGWSWAESKLPGAIEEQPFQTFPLIDREAVGAEGMKL
ncbi:hypothetical protein BDV97DRAFT_368258 [Delphinella strobiligena]|nr:hypothetical protein BDV97DRAFT_368258 [Delphinella strobiligena]